MHVVARTVAAVAGFEWSWAADQLEELVTAAGWIYRQPSEGTVSCAFDAAPGRAGAFLFGAEVTAVFLSLREWDGNRREADDNPPEPDGNRARDGNPPEADDNPPEPDDNPREPDGNLPEPDGNRARDGNLHQRADVGVPARRDGFVAAIAEVSVQLGPPVMRCPGPDPSVGWRVAAGVLEIVDRPAVLDLWLRPAPRRVPHTPVPPVDGAVDWPSLEVSLAAAAASLPAGASVQLVPGAKSGAEALAELSQTESSLTVRVRGETRTIDWPAAGDTYRTIAGSLVDALRAGAANPDGLAYRADLPVPYLPLRREIRRT